MRIGQHVGSWGLLVLPVFIAAAWAADDRATVGQDIEMVFPENEWARADPNDLGFDTAALEEIGNLIQAADANSMLVYNGRVVSEWNHGGAMDRQYEVQSITKTLLSSVLGLSLDNGLVPSLDTPVRDVFPAFAAGTYTNEITFRHLVTMTSGIKPTRYQLHYPYETAPGTILNYHADVTAHLARALTYLNEQPLFDVLKEGILDPIGASGSWSNDSAPWSPVTTESGEEIPVHAGYAFFNTSVPDLARVGHLYLNDGKWNDTQLLSPEYVGESWTVIPQKPLRDYHQGEGYGFYWWQHVPGVWFMSGTGYQFCMVWPERGIVMTKVNHFSNSAVEFGEIFPLVYRAVTGEDFVPPPAADFDKDGDVDGDDFLQWQGDFGVYGDSDADYDYDTDGDDFLIWQRQFGSVWPPPPGAQSVIMKSDFGGDYALTEGSGLNLHNNLYYQNGPPEELNQSLDEVFDTNGNSTAVTLTIVDGSFAMASNGAGTPTPGAPARDFFVGTATSDSLFTTTDAFDIYPATPQVAYEIAGLDPNTPYDFTFFASRMGVGEDDIREASYSVDGNEVLLDASNNVDDVAQLLGLDSGEDGTMTLIIKAGPNNTHPALPYYLGAMVIQTASQGAAATAAVPGSSVLVLLGGILMLGGMLRPVVLAHGGLEFIASDPPKTTR